MLALIEHPTPADRVRLREQLRVCYAASGESVGVATYEPHRLRQQERTCESRVVPRRHSATRSTDGLRAMGLRASLFTFFQLLDRWERQSAGPHPDFSIPLRASFAASDLLLAGFTHVLDQNLSQELDQLDHHRALVIASSTMILAVALGAAGLIARRVRWRQRRQIARLRDVALKEARFQAIFAGSPLPIAITDLSGTVLEFNDAYVALVGESALRPGRTLLLGAATPDGIFNVSSLFELATPRTPVEVTLAQDGASPIICDATATFVRTPGDNAAYCAVMLQDITERQLREHRLQYEATHDALTGDCKPPSCADRAMYVDKGRAASRAAAIHQRSLHWFCSR